MIYLFICIHKRDHCIQRTLHFLLYARRICRRSLLCPGTQKQRRRCGLRELKSSSNSIERRPLRCCKRAKPLWLFPLATPYRGVRAKNSQQKVKSKTLVFLICVCGNKGRSIYMVTQLWWILRGC